MQVYEKLDLPIKSKCSQDIPLTTQQTLLYFWKASHKFVQTSPELSQTLLRSFVELSRESCAEYPDTVTQRICSQCCTLLLPGLTATCRLKPSPSRHKRKRSKDPEDGPRSKNYVVITCTVCQTRQDSVCGWYKRSDACAGEGSEVSPVPAKVCHQGLLGSSVSSVFGDSFVPLGGNSSSSSNFISLGGKTALGVRDRRGGIAAAVVAGPGAKASGFNFLGKKLTPPPAAATSSAPFSISPATGMLSRTPLTAGGGRLPHSGSTMGGTGCSALALSTGGSSGSHTGSVGPSSGGGSGINLLAMEKEQKKLKKKRLSFSNA